jgi:hypothetical protein
MRQRLEATLRACCVGLVGSANCVRIPMKPDAYSKVKPDSRSDFIPVSVPN